MWYMMVHRWVKERDWEKMMRLWVSKLFGCVSIITDSWINPISNNAEIWEVCVCIRIQLFLINWLPVSVLKDHHQLFLYLAFIDTFCIGFISIIFIAYQKTKTSCLYYLTLPTFLFVLFLFTSFCLSACC